MRKKGFILDMHPKCQYLQIRTLLSTLLNDKFTTSYKSESFKRYIFFRNHPAQFNLNSIQVTCVIIHTN